MKRLIQLPLLLLLLVLGVAAHAQNKTVTGKVLDEKGTGLPGASILIKGTSNGVATQPNGSFSISAPNNATLVFSFIGYKSQEIQIGNQSDFTVRLQPSNTTMDELVVIGYGAQKKKDLTGSVGSVKGDAIKNVPATNVTEAIQGRVAGVEVVKNSGEPGAAPSIIIRGLSSLNQPQPLYIVDGVRTSGDNINIQDIATVDILKDASAAAIYGSAAAGGVIVITTKRGQGAKPVINLNARYGITKPKLVKLMDKQGFLDLMKIVRPTLYAGMNTDTLPNTNWVDALYGDASEQNYNLSIAGSTPSVNYLFSGFYNKQDGIYIKNSSDIAGARINTDYKINDWLKIGEQVYFTSRKTIPPVGSEAQLHNAPFRTVPTMAIYEKDGTYGRSPIGFAGPNPFGAAMAAKAENFKQNFQGNVYGEVKLPFHLTFKTTYGYSYYQETQDMYQGPYNFGEVKNPSNFLNKLYYQNRQVYSNYLLTYDQTFGKHQITALAGYEQITNKSNNINVTESNVGLPTYSFIQTSGTAFTVNGVNDPNGLIKSFFGRLNYNYAGKYYISGSIRRDANFTVFGPGKQAGVFPAASAGWNISEEKFFEPAKKIVDNLKIRGSYGTLGNSNIPAYLFLSTYNQVGMQNYFPGAPAVIANNINFIPNPNIHWETLHETNIGIDGEALRNRMYFSIDWYDKTTKEMLYALPISTSSGITSAYYTNIGSVRNRGIELMLGYKDKVGELGYDVTFTAGFNKNKVLNLDNINSNYILDGYNYYSNGDPGFSVMPGQNVTITKVGAPFGQFYGFKTLGLFKSDEEANKSAQKGVARAGDLIFEDVTGDGKITDEDRTVIGDPNPDMVYGINLRFTYKGFDIAMLFNGVAGVDLFNGVKAYSMYPFADGNTTNKVWGASFLNGNDLTDQPRLGVQNPNGTFTLDPNKNYTTVNSYFVENGNYLKLKNLQIGYNFNHKLLERAKISSARVFLMANNLFTITRYTGLDPEVGGAFSARSFGAVTTRGLDAVSQYPQTRIFSIGVDLSF
ncbi:SusC/RagA family TonB-linked outer membrane protein [Chitinophaga skermanii]|nr:TonB-dependent receptor [Chitinophaga skermanii]